MNHKARHKLLTVLFTLLWVGSYFLLYYGFGREIFGSKSSTGLEFFGGGLLVFLAPIIPLWLALFYSRKIMSTKQLVIGLLAIFALMFAYPAIMFIGAITYRGEGWAGAMILGGLAFLIIVFLTTQLLFSLLFLFLQNRELKKAKPQFSKVHILSLAIYLIIVASLLGYISYKEQAFENYFCSNESGNADGSYSQIFFLKPITKKEVVRIVKENNFKVSYILVAKKENLDNPFRFHFNPAINSQTVEQKLESQLQWFSFNGPQPERSVYLPLLQAYEANEPVIWFLDFENVPMETMTKFVYELDVQKRLLGVDYSSWAGELGSDPRNIQPATSEQPVIQSKCYKKIVQNV